MSKNEMDIACSSCAKTFTSKISEDYSSYEEFCDECKNKGKNDNKVTENVKKGISFGCCLAMVVSYTAWQSIPWAIFHGLLSWVYVIYYFLAHG